MSAPTQVPKLETLNPKPGTLPVTGSLDSLKARLLRWAAGFPYCLVLDNCGSEVDRYGQYEFLVGVGQTGSGISSWEELIRSGGEWIMGGLPYELKNRFEPSLRPSSKPGISFPETAFFRPETVIAITRGSTLMQVSGKEPGKKLMAAPGLPSASLVAPRFESNFTRKQYLQTVRRLQEHIVEGDCYEINLSQVFRAECRLSDPAGLFERLRDLSPVPFAAFFRFGHQYLLSASPERFLQLRDGRLLTQPIKGTAPRGDTARADAQQKAYLRHSEKEQAENIMIVDLSRNDLYRSSEPHSVEVPQLFEVQTFPQVHQLVSTITGRKRPELSPWQVLQNTFPAGSMTGAPKVRTMELIDRYEGIQRGLYAGSVGYVNPDGDFDFNVVIRSLVYDDHAQQLNYQVGGAITYDSDPAAEYEETLVKARAIRQLFER